MTPIFRPLLAATALAGLCLNLPAFAQDATPPQATPQAAAPQQPAHKAPKAKKPAKSPAAAQTSSAQTSPAQTPASAAAPAAGSAPGAAPATGGAAAALGGGNSGPLQVSSDNGIEWQQTDKVYIARGNAVATRGTTTVYGDVLSAYYRDIPNSSQTEVWRVTAEGHVKITTPTQTVVGDHGVYDIDTKTVVVTGQHLQLTTPQDVVTARDSLEWYDDKQLAVARGDALEVRGDHRVRGDILAATVSTAPGQPSRISRIDANGHVIVTGPDQVGTGDTGVYDLDTAIATLAGHVTLARGPNTMVGQYGVVDLNKGVSRLLPRPPNLAAGTTGRVQGILIPRSNNGQPGQPKPPGDKSGSEKSEPKTPGSRNHTGLFSRQKPAKPETPTGTAAQTGGTSGAASAAPATP